MLFFSRGGGSGDINTGKGERADRYLETGTAEDGFLRGFRGPEGHTSIHDADSIRFIEEVLQAEGWQL